MKNYLEKVLHQNVQLSNYAEQKKLPLAYRNNFELYIMKVNMQDFVLAVPSEDMNLADLRRQQKMLEHFTGYFCALYLKKMNYYAKDRMLDEGIPFVWENHQIYLPFLGILLNENDGRAPKPCVKISFLTQKLLLKALYEEWTGVTVTKAAEFLKVSKMSVTRCFDEIEVLEMPFLQTKSRARKFFSEADKKNMWEQIRPFMRNPVIAEFRLGEMIHDKLPLSGLSALTEYSLLSDNSYPTYAAIKPQMRELNLYGKKQVPLGDIPKCVVQEMGYILPFGKGTAVDPLSLTLIVSEADREDPRIHMSIDAMLEEYVW